MREKPRKPFSRLRKGGYRVILADPPWPFGRGRLGREKGYESMTGEQIRSLPVGDLARENCLLFLWIRAKHLPLALETIEAWGFKYVTMAFVWIKTSKSNEPIFGIGYWTRNSAEICLLAKKGHPLKISSNVRQTIIAQTREHSRKPDEQYEKIEAMSRGPYVELFARQSRENWTSWGDEVEKFERGN